MKLELDFSKWIGCLNPLKMHTHIVFIQQRVRKYCVLKLCSSPYILDPRAQTWNLLFTESPPIPLIILLSSYYFLIRFGPVIMKNRKPYDLKKVMIYYNAFQVITNGLATAAVSF